MALLSIIRQMSRQVSNSFAGDYQAEEQAGVVRLSWRLQADEQADVEQLRWRLSGRRAGRCLVAQLAYTKQMCRQVSRGPAGDYQADEQAGVSRLSWRLSKR